MRFRNPLRKPPPEPTELPESAERAIHTLGGVPREASPTVNVNFPKPSGPPPKREEKS